MPRTFNTATIAFIDIGLTNAALSTLASVLMFVSRWLVTRSLLYRPLPSALSTFSLLLEVQRFLSAV